MVLNVRTGEILDWSQATEEEILDDLRELEEVYQLAKQARCSTECDFGQNDSGGGNLAAHRCG